ncbi:GTPase [Actinomyces faecalis]|uniref:GTPase n=1 Tax=Actinomyces faecalis TaxID=2722820 RepID=UPI001554DC30|nr:GTPase [Actinomyces faecalis]
MTSADASPAARLEARLEALRQALDECPTEVPASLAIPARNNLDSVAERLALGVDHTVVALFGGTGSGKSSLFNALTQLEFADVGARRPTTSRAAACTWGDDASALLTFLGVDPERRIRRESLLDGSDQDDLAGLVLLDVPDYDSVTAAHALQVDRLVPLADILVWVLDPQKYADSALHDGYLRGLGARQEDMLVLVNQVDTLPEGSRDRLMEDVHSLLVADGLEDVTVLPVSAVRGDNLAAVRQILLDRVVRESNAARTATAELDRIATRLLPTAAARGVEITQEPRAELVDTLVKASGAGVVADSIRVNLAKVVPAALARPEPPARSAVEASRTRWLAHTSEGMPSVWSRSVSSAVSSADSLGAQVAEGVASVRLPASRSAGIELAWWGGAAALIVGLVWTAVALATGGPFWVPVVAAGVGVVAALWARGARRRRAQAEAESYAAAVWERVEAVVARGLVEPASGVLDRHRRLQQALRR